MKYGKSICTVPATGAIVNSTSGTATPHSGGGQFHLRTSSDRCLKGSRHFLLTELVVWVKLVGWSVFFSPLEIFLGPRKRLEIVGKVPCA